MQIDGLDPYSTYIPPQTTPPPEATEPAPPPTDIPVDESSGNAVDTTA
ncbi:MAG: hypothetical protein JW904_04735 [Spirochaetales bacterium]|nr:hypothetical protein [Spirochaetales bacterium]